MAKEQEDLGEVRNTRRGLLQGAGLTAALALLGGAMTPAQAAVAGRIGQIDRHGKRMRGRAGEIDYRITLLVQLLHQSQSEAT